MCVRVTAPLVRIYHHRWTQSEKVAPSRATPSSCSFAMVSSSCDYNMNDRTAMHRHSIQRNPILCAGVKKRLTHSLPILLLPKPTSSSFFLRSIVVSHIAYIYTSTHSLFTHIHTHTHTHTYIHNRSHLSRHASYPFHHRCTHTSHTSTHTVRSSLSSISSSVSSIWTKRSGDDAAPWPERWWSE